jgi:lysine-ketoglutarate reductase/saccharopine dehydrogenase-like protein (TIGR00300 family)
MPSETIELRGHIIDSLILPKVLDEIIASDASFKIAEIRVGEQRADQSFARIEVKAPSADALDDLVLRLRQHGAEVKEKNNVQLAAAPADGVFPQGFYVTTSQRTFVRVAGSELEVHPAMMNSAIVVDRAANSASAKKFYEIRKGMEVVVGHQGIRVAPLQRTTARTDVFEFMSGSAAVERPRSAVIRDLARELEQTRAEKGRILFVVGPAIVATGAGEYLEKLIEGGFVQLLFAGNSFAAHDVERALFGTSLGVNPGQGTLPQHGSQNHLRAINAVRGAGSIEKAVSSGLLQKGILHHCIRQGVDVVLAGSISDEGPLPDVITDAIEAQKMMRARLEGITIALLLATTLHATAARNLLPATVKVFCLDRNPAVVSKITGRGTFQAVGLATDVEPFLRELTENLAPAR